MTQTLFPYRFIEGGLRLLLSSLTEIPNSKNVFHLYEINESIVTFKIDVVVPNLLDIFPNKDQLLFDEEIKIVTNFTSKKSLTRFNIFLDFIKEENGNFLYSKMIDINKDDYFGDIIVEAFAVINKTDEERPKGLPLYKGSKLSSSNTYLIQLEQNSKTSSGSGDGISVSWISFKDPKFEWLNDRYSNQIYAIDPTKDHDLPKLYLNKDIDRSLINILENTSNQPSFKTASRDLFFQTIGNGVLAELLTSSFIKFRENYLGINGDEVSLDNAKEAREGLHQWQQTLIENYLPFIFPDLDEKEFDDNLTDIIVSNSKFNLFLRRLPNIIQEALKTDLIFNKVSQLTK